MTRLGEPLRGASPRSRRAIRSITFTPAAFGGSAAIPLATRLRREQVASINANNGLNFMYSG
jgi:hypothetical protein